MSSCCNILYFKTEHKSSTSLGNPFKLNGNANYHQVRFIDKHIG
ncbi:hypothetical protein [Clostridium pasteurianum]|nr:hypothetical protein [Clostridium pasteurianum]